MTQLYRTQSHVCQLRIVLQCHNGNVKLIHKHQDRGIYTRGVYITSESLYHHGGDNLPLSISESLTDS